MGLANERRRYIVTSSLIGRVHTQNEPWTCSMKRITCISTHWPLGDSEWNLRQVIFNISSVIDRWDISCENALRWMLVDLTVGTSILVQVMVWRRRATSHYPSHCWPRSMSPYDVATSFGVIMTLLLRCVSAGVTWQTYVAFKIILIIY